MSVKRSPRLRSTLRPTPWSGGGAIRSVTGGVEGEHRGNAGDGRRTQRAPRTGTQSGPPQPPQWRTIQEVMKLTGWDRRALNDKILTREIPARKVSAFGGFMWVIDWARAKGLLSKHIPRPHKPHNYPRLSPITDETWQKFLVVFDKFLWGECEPAPAGRPVRRR